jgi:hypothetical protein
MKPTANGVGGKQQSAGGNSARSTRTSLAEWASGGKKEETLN